jgi:hypothetical protein
MEADRIYYGGADGISTRTDALGSTLHQGRCAPSRTSSRVRSPNT